MARRRPTKPSVEPIDGPEVVRFLSDDVARPVKTRELARLMNVAEREYRNFRALIHELIAGGELVRLKRGRIGLPDALALAVGTVKVRGGRHWFVRVDGDDGPEELFVRPRERKTALEGDKVMVRRYGDSDGRSPEAGIVKIIERAHKPLIGTFRRGRYFTYVVPEAPSPIAEVYIPPKHTKNAQPGQIVAVQTTYWDDPHQTPEGKITEVLGFPGDPGVDIRSIIAARDLPGRFPKDVGDEAAAIPGELTASDITGRDDFRGLVTFTIDPADAKDHDDAVSLEELPNGNRRLGVHIADVSHYVTPGTALDAEAYERATSVYLVDRVIPMLPVRISNDLCSLRPRRDRLTMSCMMDITPAGEVVKYRFCNSVIHSNAKLSYEDAYAYHTSRKTTRKTAKLAATLDGMFELSAVLRRNRFADGALDLIVPEVKVLLDDDGHPTAIEQRQSNEAHQLVEEFMLIANRCAANTFLKRNNPALYRVHANPDPEKIRDFAAFVETLGYRLSIRSAVTPKRLAALLKKTENDPRREMIHMMMLRSLAKAEYAPGNIGHFGLAFPHYVHFTSPIRRYPDLWIHRHLKLVLDRKYTVKRQRAQQKLLPQIGRHTSEQERNAETAERESVRLKQLEYLEQRLGDDFVGRVSGFLDFGFFVALEHLGIDGLVRFSGVDDDYYHLEKDQWRVVGRRSKRTFRLGDEVNVRLIKTDADRGEVDLVLTESVDREMAHRRKHPRGTRGRPRRGRGHAFTSHRRRNG